MAFPHLCFFSGTPPIWAGLNRAAQLPLDGLQLGRSRSRTWTPQHRRSSGVFSNRRLDEWLFPIEDEEASRGMEKIWKDEWRATWNREKMENEWRD